MHDPKNISIADYTYDLPEERIAVFPLAERDASRLLVYQNETIREDNYKNIAAHIPENSLLVFNNTKVVEARLLFQKPTGGVIEIFCLEPHEQYPDITTAMSTTGKVWWQCLVGGASKWKNGQVLEKTIKRNNESITLFAAYLEKRPGCFIIELSWQPAQLSFAEVLHAAGAIPLPPYIKRNATEADSTRYQTVYAQHDGSVAAPTAGLHFTDRIFHTLAAKNIQTDYVTLHVGAGTFKPVKSSTLADHEMHAEYIDVGISLLRKLLSAPDNKIIAVGTTSLRTLESLYWIGCAPEKILSAASSVLVSQWEPYETTRTPLTTKESLENLLSFMKRNGMDRLIGKTQILITPGYQFRVISGLITNFHQPQSTLLLLVAALVGDQWRSIYDYALANDFRFLSYGDGCLLWKR